MRSAGHRSFCIQPLEPRCLLSGNGLTGNYYDNMDFTNRAMTRHDAVVDFNFGTSGPVPQMGADTYSVKWTGQIIPGGGDGNYTFYVNADDGVRLFVRGQEIIDRWTDGSGEVSGVVGLSGTQKVDIELDYYNHTGNGSAHLMYSGPGISKQVVPNSALYDSFGVNYSFSNPIAPSGADPWVTLVNGNYYYARSDGGALYVGASTSLQNIAKAPATRVFNAAPGTGYAQDLWAPELHFLDGKWYIYFAADAGGSDFTAANATHRMYVLQSLTSNPQGSYAMMGEIAATPDRGVPTQNTAFPVDHWAIDGTVLTVNNQRYFVWSGWPGTTDGQQDLYIAKMSSDWTITGARTLLSAPTYSWEQNGLPINEGPEALYHNGDTFIVYSASGYWTNQYALGELRLKPGMDPLLQSSWTKSSTPVFASNANAVGVGHASFTTSPDGRENWIVYHAHDTTGAFTGNRDVRMQSFTWNADGTPNFGSPVAKGVDIPEPSGTPHFTAAFSTTPVPPATASNNIVASPGVIAKPPTVLSPVGATVPQTIADLLLSLHLKDLVLQRLLLIVARR